MGLIDMWKSRYFFYCLPVLLCLFTSGCLLSAEQCGRGFESNDELCVPVGGSGPRAGQPGSDGVGGVQQVEERAGGAGGTRDASDLDGGAVTAQSGGERGEGGGNL